jgi:uncharacterized protein YndB with AHSA1/START domain
MTTTPEALAAASQEFIVSRVFDAPRERVWRAWTGAEHLAHWWGPKGCRIRIISLDVRPGGVFHYAMQFKPALDWYGRFVFRDIARPERLAFVTPFSDPDGGIARAPFSATWPLEILNVVTFAEQGGRTSLTPRGGPIDATEEERRTIAGMFDSMRQGFGGTFDQLAGYLAKP